MEIISHRANLIGSDKRRENTAEACEECLNLGFGLELDVRNYLNGLYAKHDPVISEDEQSWLQVVSVVSNYPLLPIAINIKETGYEQALVNSIFDLCKENIFLFDLELVVGIQKYESLLSTYKALDLTTEVAVRVSDHNETIERAVESHNRVIWLDEFDSFWASQGTIQELKKASKKIYAVAPDLHKHSLDISMSRCKEFALWNVDGICTDYPIMLKNILEEVN
ncbi:MAG: hypothetical protein LH649_08530 [Pseudanabaena sp. CAN_BIN31]|nr:hypothetical protein [Pseudanabaena sp. CAN_BIN31]